MGVVTRRPASEDRTEFLRWRAWRARRFGRFLVALQVLALALSLQVSGLAHGLADLCFHDDCAGECERDPLNDTDGDSECPPGCPSCHACVHVQSLYVPVGAALVAPAVTDVAVPPLAASQPPGNPFRASVFRPPRA